jgi:hypothetical protein
MVDYLEFVVLVLATQTAIVLLVSACRWLVSSLATPSCDGRE